MKNLIRFSSLVLICLALTACSSAPKKPESLVRGDYSHAKEHISWLAKKEMKQNDIVGLSIALVDDQRVVWAEGFGFADQEKNLRASPDTIYRVGSISKLLTATAAMQLAEQGKLSIDKPLRTYLPEFSIKSRFPDSLPITPRMIMTHHSGLPSDLQKGMWSRNPEPIESVVGRIKDEYAAYPPNTVYSYSNLGMSLLGIAIAKVADKDFAVAMNETLLQPLSMANSSFAAFADQSVLGAKAYRKGELVEEPALRDIPAGGLNTTVLDLSRFMQMAFANGRTREKQIIKPETLAEMLRPQNSTVPLDLNFSVGIGWHLSGLGGIDIKNAGTVAHHAGATINYHGMLITLPQYKLGVVVLSNSSTSGKIVNKIAEEALKLALEAKAGIRQPEKNTIEMQEATLPKDEMQSYEGRYATFIGMVPVTNKTDYLKADVMGASLRLIPRSDAMLGLQYKLFGLFPIGLGDLDRIGIKKERISGRDILKARLDEQELLVGERISPVPIPGPWKKHAGAYEIINAGDDHNLVEEIRLREEDGLLVVEYAVPLLFKGRMKFALNPISDTEAVIHGLGRGMGETISVVMAGNEELLRYSGYFLRRKGE